MNVGREFSQVDWDGQTIDDCQRLIQLAVREDLGCGCDLTTCSLVPPHARGSAKIVARQTGVICGMMAAELVFREMEIDAEWTTFVADGTVVQRGTELARIGCSARDLLTAERTVLNFIGRLSGVATQTRRYVEAVAGTSVRIYDTRKTTPGWRRLEKYAVRCGGGHNHRTGLYDAILIKDNHLAVAARLGNVMWTPADAVRRSREFLGEWFRGEASAANFIVEVEVDTIDQFRHVLPVGPDIILLDNMSLEQLREAVGIRNEAHSTTQLEASGGITLDTIRSIAETGVDRISSGALTHSAIVLDVALDWE